MALLAESQTGTRALIIDIHPEQIRSSGRRFTLDTECGEADAFRVVCGDPQDLPQTSGFLGNGILVEVNADQTLEIFSSLSGLPQLYRCRTAGHTFLATDLQRLMERSRIRPRLDWDTVTRMGAHGRPAPGHTLFDGIDTIAPGTRLHLTRDGALRTVGHFEPPDMEFESSDAYVQAQRDAFRRAVGRMQLDDAFLSLTAGLDTRAILAVLVELGQKIETATIGDPHASIDGMRARELAAAYGLRHTVVRLDHAYREALPSLSESVSLRTGGLCSFSQAPDLWLYEQLKGRYAARISGNLGNQVGRNGTEGVSTRGARLDILAGDGGVDRSKAAQPHWLCDTTVGASLESPGFLIQVESLCALAANYSLGSSFCMQRTPYADRELIALKLLEPPLDGARSPAAIRMQDLWHRFMGVPLERSFQRRAIVEVGGVVGDCPVNWGWRPRGGISPAATLLGFGALADLALGMMGKRVPFLNQARFTLGLAGLAEIERREQLYHGPMPDFVRDTILSRKVRESGVFAMERLEALVTDGCDDRRNFATLEFALDMALAIRTFL